MKIGETDIDLMFGWAVHLASPLQFVNEQMTKAFPIQTFMARTWSCPLALLLVVDLAAVSFAGLNVVENRVVVAAITLATSYSFSPPRSLYGRS
jgi:hypothetical protein